MHVLSQNLKLIATLGYKGPLPTAIRTKLKPFTDLSVA